jgi:hypothetical protein
MVSVTSSLKIHGLHFRRRHFGEIAEAADNLLQIRELRQQRRRPFAKDFVELLGVFVARPLHVLHGDLQREQRILQLVRQPPRQFAPRRHALGLHQALALFHQFVSHAIESARQLPDLVFAGHFHGGAPVAGGHPAGAFRQPLHRPRDARRGPPAQHDRHQDAADRHHHGGLQHGAFQFHQIAARVADQQHAQHVVLAALERQRVKRLRRSSPADGAERLAPLLFHLLDQRTKE